MSGHVDDVFHPHRDPRQRARVNPLGKLSVNPVGGFPGALVVDDHEGLQLRIEVFRGSQCPGGDLPGGDLTTTEPSAQFRDGPGGTHSHRASKVNAGSSV